MGVKHFLAALDPGPRPVAAVQPVLHTIPPVRHATDGSIIEQFPYHPIVLPRDVLNYLK